MNIGIDIDDTISNTYEYLFNYSQQFDVEVLGKSGEITGLGTSTNHNYFSSIHNWTDQETEQFLDQYYKDVLTNVKPRLFAPEVLQKLKQEGNHIYLITARFPHKSVEDVSELTAEWLKENHIPYDELIINAQDKLEVAKEKKIDIFIDDSFKNCKAMADHQIKSILMDTRNNEKLQADNIERAYSWPQLKKKLEDYQEKKI